MDLEIEDHDDENVPLADMHSTSSNSRNYGDQVQGRGHSDWFAKIQKRRFFIVEKRDAATLIPISKTWQNNNV